MSSTPKPSAEPGLVERVGLRQYSERRRRVWRSAVLFLAVTTTMILLAVSQRDAQAVRHCRGQLERALVEFERARQAGRAPAPRLAHGPDSPPLLSEHYYYNVLFLDMVRSVRPVATACCAHRHRLFLRPDGRHVMTYDGAAFRIEWMTEGQFLRRSEALALPASLRD